MQTHPTWPAQGLDLILLSQPRRLLTRHRGIVPVQSMVWIVLFFLALCNFAVLQGPVQVVEGAASPPQEKPPSLVGGERQLFREVKQEESVNTEALSHGMFCLVPSFWKALGLLKGYTCWHPVFLLSWNSVWPRWEFPGNS